ncbi:MAG TPA: alpha/beta hydrolase [Actinospica sp.]|nr:alpha/beta hydrolase [Actinospica sp.]
MTTQITYGVLKAAQPSAYDAAATALQPVIDGFEQATVDLNHGIYQKLEYSWSGAAASAALSRIGSTVADYQATLDYLDRFQGLLRTAFDGISEAQAYLKAAETIAANNGWQLDENGQAQPVVSGALRNRALVQQVWQSMTANPEYLDMLDLIGRALSTAQAVNDQVSQAMADAEQYGHGANWKADAAAAESSAAAMGTRLEQAGIPAKGTDSAEVNAWWKAMGPSAQVQLVKDQPALIGALNGIPAMVRDKANRIVLSDDINHDLQQQSALNAQQRQVQAEIDQLYANGQAVDPRTPNVPSYQLAALTNQLNSIDTRLAGINGQLPALQNLQHELTMGGQPYTFAGRPTTMPPMYLLGFDTNNAGHAIVACGNPDTAKNVCVYVPGLNTSSNSTHFQFDIQHTQNMTLAADQDTGSNDTATILWLGYNSPQVDGLKTAAVAGTGDATDAVPNLTSFVTSLRNVNGEISNLTLLGHSYGSVVVGETAMASHLPVNNIVLVGSPGVEAGSASALNIDPKHVWTGTAPNDPVARFGWFGQPPTDPGFGANQFTVNATGGGGLFGQHGEYFDDPFNNTNNDHGGSSLTNIGYIISGQTNKVALVHPAIPAPPRSNPMPSPPFNAPSPTPQTPSPQP